MDDGEDMRYIIDRTVVILYKSLSTETAQYRRIFHKKLPFKGFIPSTSSSSGVFSSSNQIGSEGFGSLCKGILDEEENRVVAIKVFNLQPKGASKSFLAECNALRNIRHTNLSTDYNGSNFKALVFEYMENGSFEEWLHGEDPSRRLNLLPRLNIAVDMTSALCYLHDHCEPPIVHPDMKPSNILLDDDMVVRVGDFVLARLIMDTS